MKRNVYPPEFIEWDFPDSFLLKLNETERAMIKSYQSYVRKDRLSNIQNNWWLTYNLLWFSHHKFIEDCKDQVFLRSHEIEQFWHKQPQVLIRFLLFFCSLPPDVPAIHKTKFQEFFGLNYWLVNGTALLRYKWIIQRGNGYYSISNRGTRLVTDLLKKMDRDASTWYCETKRNIK